MQPSERVTIRPKLERAIADKQEQIARSSNVAVDGNGRQGLLREFVSALSEYRRYVEGFLADDCAGPFHHVAPGHRLWVAKQAVGDLPAGEVSEDWAELVVKAGQVPGCTTKTGKGKDRCQPIAGRIIPHLIGWAEDELRRDHETLGQKATPPAPAPAEPETKVKPRAKRSTVPGEGRDKLIAALTKHHQYADGGCLNQEPLGNNELARLAVVSKSTASDFFDNEFNRREKGGFAKYQVICRDAGRLADALKVLNGDFSPHDLYGRRPPGEDEFDDDKEE